MWRLRMATLTSNDCPCRPGNSRPPRPGHGSYRLEVLVGLCNDRLARCSAVRDSLIVEEPCGKLHQTITQFEEDKLPAIAAIAEKFSPSFGGGYLAGLWRQYLVQDLLWYPSSTDEAPGPRFTGHGPTWPWA
ncbi:uncharacterized protein B0T15DRAFT_187276 [Chaetomium strumarium]|uniref:Uncharacterized protein n=1 Tax=Chaetomium strumarium TaxID=1170767 RepID=A0AAJ0GRY9_9PEZI|nr:hypothetical protein B0T15DRAFT_187276 [Chaetomium strumarium]